MDNLDFSYQEITSKQLVRDIFPKILNTKHNYLDLSHNKIILSCTVVNSLMDCLEHNPQINRLNISFNQISDAGFKLMATRLANNITLETINIGGPLFSIHNKQFDYLICCLKQNDTLTELLISSLSCCPCITFDNTISMNYHTRLSILVNNTREHRRKELTCFFEHYKKELKKTLDEPDNYEHNIFSHIIDFMIQPKPFVGHW